MLSLIPLLYLFLLSNPIFKVKFLYHHCNPQRGKMKSKKGRRVGGGLRTCIIHCLF
jgi:hypothetical protein